jgi:hypothetical protein
MEATKVCTLGQITSAFLEVGGQYRIYVIDSCSYAVLIQVIS